MTRPIRFQQCPADVVIVGSGLAGLCAALALAPLRVCLVTSRRVGQGSGSAYAKGGLAAAQAIGDTTALHMEDTILAGAGLTDPDVAAWITGHGPTCIEWLEKQGIRFDRDASEGLVLGREGAHQQARVVHVQGDQTGYHVTRALAQAVLASDHVTVLDDTTAEAILTDQTGVASGVRVRTHPRTSGVRTQTRPESIFARHIILATGGTGGLFAHTTNPVSLTGRGLALAARAGAALTHLEFTQFHPTALDVPADPLPLITEALRGAGATLVDANGQSLMAEIDARGDLAPRDVVAHQIWRCRSQGQKTYLDARHLSRSDWETGFPSAFSACQQYGLDPTAGDLIPIIPAAHYQMGGIVTDLQGRTTVPYLWGVGEVAATGLHGANRLASNSLTEAVVMGRACAAAILGADMPTPSRSMDPSGHKSMRRSSGISSPDPDTDPDIDPDTDFWPWIRHHMTRVMGVVRSGQDLQDWSVLIRATRSSGIRSGSAAPLNTAQQDAALVADLMIASAVARCESRGSHQRTDAPKAKSSYLGHFLVRLTEDGIPALSWQAGSPVSRLQTGSSDFRHQDRPHQSIRQTEKVTTG